MVHLYVHLSMYVYAYVFVGHLYVYTRACMCIFEICLVWNGFAQNVNPPPIVLPTVLPSLSWSRQSRPTFGVAALEERF